MALSHYIDDDVSKIFDILMEYFNYDGEKVLKWIDAPNPLLGNVSPGYLIQLGKAYKVLGFVQDCEAANKRSPVFG